MKLIYMKTVRQIKESTDQSWRKTEEKVRKNTRKWAICSAPMTLRPTPTGFHKRNKGTMILTVVTKELHPPWFFPGSISHEITRRDLPSNRLFDGNLSTIPKHIDISIDTVHEGKHIYLNPRVTWGRNRGWHLTLPLCYVTQKIRTAKQWWLKKRTVCD